jgi:hypothetical protein
MSGQPLEVSIALGLVLSELAQPPFQNRIITFSRNPHWQEIGGSTLFERVQSLQHSDWGMNTDFYKVFQLILKTAIDNRTAANDMPQSCFVFSDMQFDASGNYDETIYQMIVKDYAAAGYKLPLLIFWNLKSTKVSFPTQGQTPNVAMLSGFSAELLKLVLEGDINPVKLMLSAIHKYPAIVVQSEL